MPDKNTRPSELDDGELRHMAIVCEVLTRVHSAQAYGLVEGGPEVNVERATEFVDAARERGLTWTDDEVDATIIALVAQYSPPPGASATAAPRLRPARTDAGAIIASGQGEDLDRCETGIARPGALGGSVRCEKPVGHVERGYPDHVASAGDVASPYSWRDAEPSA